MSKYTQQAALQGYLDALLNDVEPEELRPEPELKPVAELAAVKHLVLLEKPKLPLIVPPVAVHQPLISEEYIRQLPTSVRIVDIAPEALEPEPEADAVAPQAELGQVSWADSAFECLLFDVAGLTLAVPLAVLGTIYPLAQQQLTPLFGQPDWFIGILPTAQGQLKVLETARWVMPERYTDGMRDELKYVISINGYDWGLAVNHVRHAIGVKPEQVKWRTQRGKRAWLAGTVIEHMCALLDVEVLAQLITGKDIPSGIDQ